MYKVLIVDDDKVIRKDIKAIIDWESNGFRVIAEVDNGADALKVISENEINLVITDIYMPVMDGVELIKKCRNEHPEVEFVVISNYDEFKYVKEAMRFGAYDYLLKYEIDPGAFLPIINSVKKKIDERINKSSKTTIEIEEKWKHVLEEKFWRNLFNDQLSCSQILSEAHKLKIDISTAPYMLILMEVNFLNTDDAMAAKAIKNLDQALSVYVDECSETFKYTFVLKVENNMWAVVLKAGEKSQGIIKNSSFYFSRALMKRIKADFNVSIFLEIGDVILKTEEFPEIFQKMMDCIESRFYYGLDAIMDISYFNNIKLSFDDTRMDELRDGIIKAVHNMDFISAEKGLSQAVEEANSKKYSPSLLYEFFTVLVFSLKKCMAEKGIDICEEKPISIEKKLRSMKTLKAIENYIKDILQAACREVCDGQGKNYRLEIRKALGFINRNYTRNLNLEYISEYVGVSKNYFCRLFKEETGENFIEYINKLRIEKAKQLIEDSGKSMKEISSMVGLDYAYFCKVFKNAVGKRPSELR